ncbi:MAG: hypothetical protein ABI721_00455 [Candidatus Dojkabacteria bacterium]
MSDLKAINTEGSTVSSLTNTLRDTDEVEGLKICDFVINGYEISLAVMGNLLQYNVVKPDHVPGSQFKNLDMIIDFLKIFRVLTSPLYNYVHIDDEGLFLNEIEGSSQISLWDEDFREIAEKLYTVPEELFNAEATVVDAYWKKVYNEKFLETLKVFLKMKPDGVNSVVYLNEILKHLIIDSNLDIRTREMRIALPEGPIVATKKYTRPGNDLASYKDVPDPEEL